MNAIDLNDLTAPRKARVEIIPLIDVIFFLLATFVLFTLSLSKIAALNMTFPQPVIDPRGGEDTTAYIQASSDGTFYWKEGRLAPAELVPAAEIAPRLADYRRRVALPRVLIRGDDKAKLGSAITLFDEVRQAGISQVSIETIVGPTGK